MIRALTLAASAAALLFAIPASAQSVRVPTADKTAAELHADIATAARKVCRATIDQQELDRCVKLTVAETVAKTGNAALAAAAKLQLAQR